ncbi:MAG: hypothetical protein K8T91_14630 [Planctomycetes bacterium]|nr:hypothetical protein [Planctomycetota bacterium]
MSNERWRIDVTDEDVSDHDGRIGFVSMTPCRCSVRLAGWVAQDDLGRAKVIEIYRNELLIPEELARRLLLQVHRVYWPEAGAHGYGGIITSIDLGQFLRQHFGEEATAIFAMVQRTIDTFQPLRTS